MRLIPVVLASLIGVGLAAATESAPRQKTDIGGNGFGSDETAELPIPAGSGESIADAVSKAYLTLLDNPRLNLVCWDPPVASEIVKVGQKRLERIEDPIRVEIRGVGRGIEVQVCKIDGKFQDNISIDFADLPADLIEEAPENCSDNPMSCMKLWIRKLQTKGQMCSPWTDVSSVVERVRPGHSFPLKWTVVSPFSAVRGRNGFGCTAEEDIKGTCYSGKKIAMAKVCD